MYYIELDGNPPAYEPLTESLEQLEKYAKPILKCQYAIAQLVFVGLVLPKLSLLFLYLRVFGFKRTFRICIYAAIVFVLVPALTYSLAQFFACRPIRYFCTCITIFFVAARLERADSITKGTRRSKEVPV